MAKGPESGAGDVDGDGHVDVIVGSTDDATFGPGTGRATVHSGLTGGVIHSFAGSAARASFGSAVAAAGDVDGDVDGDGRADVIAGAPQSSSTPGAGLRPRPLGREQCARLPVRRGFDRRFLRLRRRRRRGRPGRGRADLIAGAPQDDNAAPEAGMARVLSGSTGAVLFQLDGAATNDGLGRSVAGAGDVDTDGFDDVVVGVPGDSAIHPVAGSVRVHQTSHVARWDGSSW